MAIFPFRLMMYTFLACLAFASIAQADDPLAAKTLIVYVTNDPNSVAVKDHYIAARFSSPSSANVCPITLTDITATQLSMADYVSLFKTPIRACLTTPPSLQTSIRYILLAYVRPYGIVLTNAGVHYYAVDSYLADIWDQYTTQDFNPVPTATHQYYVEDQSEGNLFAPFISFDSFRSQPRSVLIYAVWRLDGPTPAIAMNLVDMATAAMNNASGGACIDRTLGDINGIIDSDTGLGETEWDLHRAAGFLGQAGLSVTEDQNPVEFGAAPAPLQCPPDGSATGFYAGWYSYNDYNGASVFNWGPGAIGFHLDSAAALDPRAGPNWAANALANNITVTSGAMNEPYVAGIPRPGGVFRNLLEGANVADAFLRNTRWLKWMILNIGDPLYRPFPSNGKAPFNPPAGQNSLAIATRDIVGGYATTGTVTLAAAAPQDTTVTLSANSSPFVSVPASVLVPQGSTSGTFTITTTPITATSPYSITATTGSVTVNNPITVFPLLEGIAASQTSVSGGPQTITGGLYLNVSAPFGGITVSLASTDTKVATVPASVSIGAGFDFITFPIHTLAVQASETTQIQATYAGTTVSVSVTANP